ncbi:hypothetical protein LTR78_005696 [Recurvomyces mirabilis]|uniref:MFS-type drug efflux transporter P55 n=1 Tax=Recurvomyces mirabilis TaxID=574656 RepID=A0AAE0WMV7_9PEZI|nr:hypothetical protein LTR78_005696 [Recurvomyces mirabilis]KAK5151181.1 hypothetical protein LTS14_009351 [Recurvomyces mirabilis]
MELTPAFEPRDAAAAAEALRRASAISSHDNFKEGWRLFRVLMPIHSANNIAFMDLAANAFLLSTIGIHFNAGDTVIWAVTAQLIGAVVGQALLGYLSDLFGRRNMLVIALGVLVAGSLVSGVSTYATSQAVFIFGRVLSGFGDGTMVNLINVAQNDFMAPRLREQFQGLQGIGVGLWSIIGVLIGATLAMKDQRYPDSHTGWPMFYYIVAILALLIGIWHYFELPGAPDEAGKEAIWARLKTIDRIGMGLLIAMVVFICVASARDDTSGCSPRKIALIVLAVLSLLAFCCWGVYQRHELRGIRPIVPFRMFSRRNIWVIFAQSLCFGMAYYSFQVFMPIYWLIVEDKSLLESATLMIPYYATHSVTSSLSPILLKMSYKERASSPASYRFIATIGFTFWTTSLILLGCIPEQVHVGVVELLAILAGAGTGVIFQNSIHALATQVDTTDRAVTIGSRNLILLTGGSVGTALSSTIVTLVCARALPDPLKHYASQAISRVDTFGFAKADVLALDVAQREGIKAVFIFCGALIGICLLLCPFVKSEDKAGLEAARRKSSGASAENYVDMVMAATKTSEEVAVGGREKDRLEDASHPEVVYGA